MKFVRKPAPKIDHHDALSFENFDTRVVEGEKPEFHGLSGNRKTADGPHSAHSKPEVAMAHPNLGEIEADSGGYAFPPDGELGGERVPFAGQTEIAKPLAGGEGVVEMSLHPGQVEYHVESVPTRERSRKIVHRDSICEPCVTNSEFGIRSSELPLTRPRLTAADDADMRR